MTAPTIDPRDGPTRQTIAPSAPPAGTAPTITAPGSPPVTDPVSSSSRARETEVQKKFAAIEEEYGRSKYLTHRRESMKIRQAPKTPVSDEYITVIRSKTPDQERREMLDQLVIREEQLKRGQWLQEEEIRAEVLPHQLRQEQHRFAYIESIDKAIREQNAAFQARREAVAEAQRYGYDSPEALQAAIREEKAIKRANELGLALTEAQIIAQTVAREGYSGAAIQYGRDPGELIAEQQAKATAAQSSLAENFGIDADPRYQEYFGTASDIITGAQNRQLAAWRLQNTLDRIDRAIQTGRPAADLPLVPAGLLDQARAAGYSESAIGALDAWRYHYTHDVTQAKEARSKFTQSPEYIVSDTLSVGLPDRLMKTVSFLSSSAGQRVATMLTGYSIGKAADPLFTPARTLFPDIPKPSEHFARHPGDLVKSALIAGGIVTGVAGAGALLGGGGATTVAGTAATGIIRTGGGAAQFAARTATPAMVEESLKAAAALSAIVIGSQIVKKTVEFPSGLPDWAEFHREPHGKIGQEGEEIPLPDWMHGDPEIHSPGVDWRAPEENINDYLDYLKKTRDGPAPTGPTPYYSGPEIPLPSPGIRHINSPELFPAPDYFSAPEVLRGRTLHSPEIEPKSIDHLFMPEIPVPKDYNIFPAELPSHRDAPNIEPHFKPDPTQAPMHPLGDPVSPIWHTPKYHDLVISASSAIGGGIGIGIGGGISRRRSRTGGDRTRDDDITAPFQVPFAPAQRITPHVAEVPKVKLIGKEFTYSTVSRAVKPKITPALTVKPGQGIKTDIGVEVPEASLSISGATTTAAAAALAGAITISRAKSSAITVPKTASPLIPAARTVFDNPLERPTVNLNPDVTINLYGDGFEQRRRDRRRRRRRTGDEWYIDYAERPTPHARLEEAYTDLTGPKIRPAKVIENIQRITIGTPARTPRRAKVVRIGPKVRRARQEVPWDVTSRIPLFGAAPQQAQKVQPRTPRAVGSGISDLFFGRTTAKKARKRRWLL